MRRRVSAGLGGALGPFCETTHRLVRQLGLGAAPEVEALQVGGIRVEDVQREQRAELGEHVAGGDAGLPNGLPELVHNVVRTVRLRAADQRHLGRLGWGEKGRAESVTPSGTTPCAAAGHTFHACLGVIPAASLLSRSSAHSCARGAEAVRRALWRDQ